MQSLKARIDALTRGGDRVEVRIGTPGGEPCAVFVNGVPSPGYRLPDRCELTITNPRPPLGSEEGAMHAES